jgi:hypothetical protein
MGIVEQATTHSATGANEAAAAAFIDATRNGYVAFTLNFQNGAGALDAAELGYQFAKGAVTFLVRYFARRGAVPPSLRFDTDAAAKPAVTPWDVQ